MLQLSCSCDGLSQEAIAEGVISAQTSMRMAADTKVKAMGRLQSPILKPDYEKCLPVTLIETAVGEGPIYDIEIDPYQFGDCDYSYDNSYYNGNDYCDPEDGKIKEEILEYIVNDGQAVIDYDIGVQPTFFSGAIGEEVIWISPALVDKNYEKEYDVSYDYSNLPSDPLDIFDPDYICCDSINLTDPNRKKIIDIVDPDYTAPCDCCPRPRPGQRAEAIRPKHNVLDSQLSKDGKHYAFAYKNLSNNEIIVEVHDRTEESWAYLAKIKTELTNFGAFTLNADATLIAVSDHEESSVHEKSGRIKIYQFDALDKQYVRVDQLGFDTGIAKSFTPSGFDFNYQDDIRTPRNFIIQRQDDEVFVLGTFPQMFSDSFAEVSEDLIDVDRIFNTTNEDDFFALLGANTFDNYAAILKDKTIRTWGNIFLPDGIAKSVNGKAEDIVSSKKAFALLTTDGKVECWGDIEKLSWRKIDEVDGEHYDVSDSLTDVKKIFSNSDCFAALKNNGQVVTFSKRFGDHLLGGSPYVWSLDEVAPRSEVDLSNIETIVGGKQCFAAITKNIPEIKGNTLVCWGRDKFGGDLDKNLFGSKIGIEKIESNRSGFAAIGKDKKITTWGSIGEGTEGQEFDNFALGGSFTTHIHPSISDVVNAAYQQSQYVKSKLESEAFSKIVPSLFSFAVLTEGGLVVTWGNPSTGGLSFLDDSLGLNSLVALPNNVTILNSESDLTGVSEIYATAAAFAALKTDGTVVTWGNTRFGGDSSSVSLNNVAKVASTAGAFATINKAGGILAWGDKEFGGQTSFNNTDPAIDLSSGFTEIYATKSGFLAFKADGTVVGWGDDANFQGIKSLEFTGLFGRSKNFGLGYSLSFNDAGDKLISGNKKRTYLSTSFEVGSVKAYERNPTTLRWRRFGQEIKTSTAFDMAIGRMVKSDSTGNRLAAYEIVSSNNEFPSKLGIYEYDGDSWKRSDRVNLFSHNKTYSPFIDKNKNIRIPHGIDISSDGKTVAFGSVNPEGDDLNGKVLVAKFDEDTGRYSNSGVINPDPVITTASDGINKNWNPSRLFGENVSLSHDGNKILVSSRESASIYEYSLILDYNLTNDWTKVSQVYSYDDPKRKTFYQASDSNSDFGRLISAHMSSGADFVSSTHFDDSVSTKQYGHYVYKIDHSKPLDRYDYDHKNNYLSFMNATIQKSGIYSQILFSKDSSIANTSSNLGFKQSIAIGKKSNTTLSTYAFWTDVKLRGVGGSNAGLGGGELGGGELGGGEGELGEGEGELGGGELGGGELGGGGSGDVGSSGTEAVILKVGNHKISLRVTSRSFDRKRQIEVIFNGSSVNKTFKGSLIPSNEYEDLFHFAITVDTTNKVIQFYEAGRLLETFKDDDITLSANKTDSYIGGFSNNSTPSQGILDDVRVFSKILSRDEIFKLANHRKIAFRLDQYYYDVVSANCNSFRLEFTSGTYLDIPIKNLCEEIVERNDCGKVINSGCVIDAKVKFCYYTGLPHPTYVKSFGRPRDNDIAYLNNPYLNEVITSLSGTCETVNELDEPFSVYGSDFFIWGSSPVPPPFDDQVVEGSGSLLGFANKVHGPKKELEGIGLIQSRSNLDFGLAVSGFENATLTTSSKWVEKFNGDFGNWTANQVIYPKEDVSSSGFINKSKENTNLYQSIDEGVFVGNSYYSEDYSVVADDSNSYITASSVNTEFDADYKFKFTDLLVRPAENRLRIKMSGPLKNYESDLPPKFHFTDVKMEDPSGDLICKYEDFTFIGDSNQYIDDANFVTYSLKPSINYADRYQWQDNYPNLYVTSGHTLSFKVKSEDTGHPYSKSAYTFAFKGDNDFVSSDQEYKDFFSVSGINPSLRITAIELYASGRKIPYKENFMNTYILGQTQGGRIERVIKPTAFLLSDFDTGVRPTASSIWEGSHGRNNSSKLGALELLSNIRGSGYDKYITTHNDASQSGKLILQFGHDYDDTFYEVKPDSFLQNAFSSIFSRWFDEDQGVFNAEDKLTPHQDGFFKVEDIKLRVLAKKNVGAEDYVLDVVGYSDDCIIHVTPAMGGFLQNTPSQDVVDYSDDSIITYSPQGTVPTDSGFGNVDDLGLSTEPVSNKDQYFEDNTSNNLGGDHDLISTYPVVSGTEFKWYEIPLRIYKDDVELGRIVDYTQSTSLEKLFLDIYPLPSGASIGAVELAVRYRPQSALEMIVEGGNYRKIQDGRTEGSFYPVARQVSTDPIFNAGSGFAPLSRIENIPHAYASPDTIKTNYARRWRGVNGVAGHAFQIDQFSRAFDERRINTPFLMSHIDFSNLEDDAPTSVKFSSEKTFENVHMTLIENGTPTSPEIHQNVGMRFSSGTMFGSMLPSYSGDYKTADWTSLTNGSNDFTNHELYGQIFDGYDRVVRFSTKTTLELGESINASSGVSAFIRFIPDANVSGTDYNFYNSSTLFSTEFAGIPSRSGLVVGFKDGYLFASGHTTTSNFLIQDTIKYSGYQYPLSVLFTYDENGDNRARLYTDNELYQGDFQNIRASSEPIQMENLSDKFTFGYAGASVSGMPMLVSEVGVTNSGNILNSGAQLQDNQVSITEFFDNIRVKFFNPDESVNNDNFKLWSYVDENTYTDWYLGAFKSCEYNFEFDALNSIKGKKTGRDLINFKFDSDGSAYSTYATKDMPSTVNSGVAYHSQLENDFLRFYLSDASSNFYATHRRVAKSLPRNYDFAEKALVVESIIEHSSSGSMVWDDGNVGPKLIVSLYTKNKEPYYVTDDPNWGLINRHYHYLHPSSCFTRLDSTFTYGDYCDDTEKWALFPEEKKLSELTEKFYSKDIDDMFVQYDIAYPSGSSLRSNLNVHTVHVRAEDAWVKPTADSGSLGLTASGNLVESVKMDMYMFGVSGSLNDTLGLCMSGVKPVKASGDFILCVSGAKSINDTLGLYTLDYGTINNSDGNVVSSLPPYLDFVVGDHDPGQFGFFLVTSGAPEPVITTLNNLSGTNGSGMGMFIEGLGFTSGILPLSVANDQQASSDSGVLKMSVFADSGVPRIQSQMPIFLLQEQYFADSDSDFGDASGNFNLSLVGAAINNNNVSETANLYLEGQEALQVSGLMNLFIDGPPDPIVQSGILELLIRNNNLRSESNVSGNPLVFWTDENYGTSIDIQDNIYSTFSADDEIRGVDLFGFGSCDGDSPDKAFDEALVVDDVIYRDRICNDGGIFRATATYTNEAAGYQDNYYGIRKLTGLKKGRPYLVNLKITTGNTDPIPVPNNWEEWEYGICDPAFDSMCCTRDCDQALAFSGVKLIGDYPYLSGNSSLIDVSGRQSGDNYGKSMKVKKDLLAVGAPNHNVNDASGYYLEDAGAIFLYRRDQEVAGKKADWQLEEKLLLPLGARRDFVSRKTGTLVNFGNFSIAGQQWEIGQEGRELGFSLDVCQSGEREVVVAGGPGGKWSRTFPTVVTSGVPVFMMLFTDKFTYNRTKLKEIVRTARKYDILYKYFSAPWGTSPDEWHPELDVNLLICQMFTSDNIDDLPSVPNTREPWFNHMYLNDVLDPDIDKSEAINTGVSGVISKFKEIFPHRNALHSGIPPIVGIFGDNTFSTNFTNSFKPILDQFVDFYNDYSLASGVYDAVNSNPSKGYVNQIFDDAFNWDQASVEILNKTLDSGNLILTDNLKFITSGVGQEYARDDSVEFQSPPESGGRVYIFEKEYGDWNLIQDIISPEEEALNGSYDIDDFIPGYGDQKPMDRFGHAVSISDNSEIISVGSPYINEACQIYERDDAENTRMYTVVLDWLTENHDPFTKDLQSHIDRYNELLAASGATVARLEVYKDLSKLDKFLLRKNKDIKLYRKVFNYDYTDIKYTGSWGVIPQEFAGTSRLGFSTAIDEEGDVVAFGAPTDSFNEFDDYNVWYGGVRSRTNYSKNNTWASYTNAGAVRVFESRKYFKHNKAVEFFKFGNLDRSVHQDIDNLSLYYNNLGTFFDVDGISFERTQFEDIEIPTDAGLAFIITPELDAASDEIIDNIKSWLALGDRTLVLVGNDPIYEENGLYEKSNDIINKILKKLGCRMRIVPARNKQESLAAGVTQSGVANIRYNTLPARLPKFLHESHAVRGSIFASGVGDIKIDLSDLGQEDFYIYHPCDPDTFDRCGLPLKHMGDVRAGWESKCDPKVEYETNWGFHFDTPNPAQSCERYPQIPKPLLVVPNNEITPVIAAAEYKPQPPIIIEADSGTEERCTTIRTGTRTETITKGTTTYSFGKETVGDPVFIIQDTNSGISGIFNSFNNVKSEYKEGFFFNPEKENARDGIIQAKGTSFYGEPASSRRKVSDFSIYVAEEIFTDNDSNKLYMIASMLPENGWSMGDLFGDQFDPRNNDQNIAFYNNLVMENCTSRANIYQLGDWTGRSSLENAFSDSVVEKVLKKNGHFVVNNATNIPSVCNVLWIADPLNAPTDENMKAIKDWLAEGDKKIVVTYGRTQQSADNVAILCDKLGIGTKPFFVEGDDNKYYVQDTDIVRNSNLSSCCPVEGDDTSKIQLLDDSNIAVSGCETYTWANSYGVNTKVDKLSAIPNGADPINLEVEFDPEGDGFTDYAYIPIKLGPSGTSVVKFRDPIYENFTENPDLFWKIVTKESNIEFPVVQNSGYRLFAEWVSETDEEKYDILACVDDLTVKFSPEPGNESTNPGDYADKYLDKTPKYSKKTATWDFRVKEGFDSVKIKFDTKEWHVPRISSEDQPTPFTPRVLAISGYLIPILAEYNETTTTKDYPIFETICSGVDWYSPERIIEQPDVFRPISTNHRKYCPPNVELCSGLNPNLDVEDGPVIVADELEHFTNFDQGLNRSRIILVTDSTIIQGQSPHFRSDPNSENGLFIRSLYPSSPEKQLGYEGELEISPKGRRFEFKQKLRAPEKGSPAKYFAASGMQNLVDRFGYNGKAGQLENYTDQEDTFVLGDVLRLKSPVKPIEIEQAIEFFGEEVIPDYGVFPRFSGMYGEATDTYDPKYLDAGIKGGISRYQEERGHDYLEFVAMNSGYPGDLFGWSIDIYKNKLVVGAPFNGFNSGDLVSWSGVTEAYNASNAASGLKLGKNGGGGSAFYYERTGRGTNAVSEFLPWEFKQKLKPNDSVGVGSDSSESGSFPDRFGYSVAVNSDFIAVGSPCHDHETLHHHIYSGTSSFIRKEFTSQFAIPDHKMYDLGVSGIRVDRFNNLSGNMIMNNGAVYTFRHKTQNFEDQPKIWEFVEKKNAQGYLDRTSAVGATSGTDGDFFGYSIALDKPLRTDGDYILTVGSPEHLFSTSGNHATAAISGAGSAYTFDAMLREQPASIPNPGSYIKATTFGLDGETDSRSELSQTVFQNVQGGPISHTVSGIVYANLNGDLFLEVSGVDPASQGFVSHRPFVESIIGEALGGTEIDEEMGLRTIGKVPESTGVLPVSILGADSAIVYNNMDLYLLSTESEQAGSGTSPLNLFVSGLDIYSSGNLGLTTSGIGLLQIGSGTNPFNLRIRGK